MLNKFEEGNYTELQKIVGISSDILIPAMVIQYVGDLDYAKYKVVSTTLTLCADDSDGETTTVLAADTSNASYNTFGELRDAINATGVFRCYLVGALPSHSANASLLAVAFADCRTKNGATLYYDIDSTTLFGFAITNQKFTYRPTGGFSTQQSGWVKDELCVNALKYISTNVTAVAAGNLIFTSCNDVDDTEKVLYTEAWESATAEAHGDTTPADIWMQANRDDRLVMVYDRNTDGNNVTGIDVTAVGSTRHVTGGEVVGSNYNGCS